jgi:ribosomal protein S18 acetylase RimI-like enzyme
MSTEMTIRKAVLQDLPYLYKICLETGASGKDASSLFNDPFVLGQYYAAPYLIYPFGFCFVAEYENRPQGYVLAAADTEDFSRWFEEHWLPGLRLQFPLPFASSLAASDSEKEIFKNINRTHFPVSCDDKKLFNEWPAHLHIDLLPSIQGKGVGKTLLQHLFAALKGNGTKGLHLKVDAQNKGAIVFYRKIGFALLEETDDCLTFGYSINR